MTLKTAHTFYNPFHADNTVRHVEMSDIVEVNGQRGYVSAIGRKYVTVKIYGGKPIRVDPLANGPVWTGEQHN